VQAAEDIIARKVLAVRVDEMLEILFAPFYGRDSVKGR